MTVRTIFEYCYRDAGNFKAFGAILLDGALPADLEAQVRFTLQDGEFFIAEQVGVPPLYDELYQWSNGPIATDHCWHEFIGFKETDKTNTSTEGAGTMTVTEFAERFIAIVQWDGALSPHFAM